MRGLLPILKRQQGFSLLEVALALAIVGIMAGFALPPLMQMIERGRFQKTQEHQEQAVTSLAVYALTHKKLPCPAASSDGIAQSSGSGVMQGYLPYRTLGLPEVTAKDGQGHWMTYGVEGTLTQTDVCAKILQGIQVMDAAGAAVVQKDGGPVAMILVSHGPLGEGAYTGEALNRHPAPDASPLEAENNNNDSRFVDGRQGLSHQAFHHMVAWKTQGQLMAHYAKQPCRTEAPSASPVSATASPSSSGGFWN